MRVGEVPSRPWKISRLCRHCARPLLRVLAPEVTHTARRPRLNCWRGVLFVGLTRDRSAQIVQQLFQCSGGGGRRIPTVLLGLVGGP